MLLFDQVPQASKKSTSISTTSLLMAKVSIKNPSKILDWVLYINYLVLFKNNEVWALINFGNKVNAMTSEYTLKLDLKIRSTNVKAQKIDGFSLNIFGIVLAKFQKENKLGRVQFF